MGGPKGAALLVFTPASWLACLLIHPTQCHRPGDTRGLGLPKKCEPNGQLGYYMRRQGNSHIDKGSWVGWRPFVCHSQEDSPRGYTPLVASCLSRQKTSLTTHRDLDCKYGRDTISFLLLKVH